MMRGVFDSQEVCSCLLRLGRWLAEYLRAFLDSQQILYGCLFVAWRVIGFSPPPTPRQFVVRRLTNCWIFPAACELILRRFLKMHFFALPMSGVEVVELFVNLCSENVIFRVCNLWKITRVSAIFFMAPMVPRPRCVLCAHDHFFFFTE
ncbi:unnamed protein product [Ectocarpus sp. 12 AP-2014]